MSEHDEERGRKGRAQAVEDSEQVRGQETEQAVTETNIGPIQPATPVFSPFSCGI